MTKRRKTPSQQELGAALRTIRQRRGFTQEALSLRSRLTEAQLSLYETGSKCPNWRNLWRYLKACEANLATLQRTLSEKRR